jgi:DNA invertase Pin-like site-specific DNA recombinase
MRAAIYCRVSTNDQSCERQERDLLAYAQRAGYEVAGVWKETVSGVRLAPPERKKLLALAQDRQINVVLVTELTRWGRSMLDLIHTLQNLHSWGVSLVAQTGLQFDLGTPQGRLVAALMASLAEFERDLLRERIQSGIAAAHARGIKSGRRLGQRVKADKYAAQVLHLVSKGHSYRSVARELHLDKNTVQSIVKRHQQSQLDKSHLE